jgi:pSer/pThr/pTyr-binding forkhead associated (FHA) protein
LPLGTDALRGATDYIPVPEPTRRRNALKHPWRIALVHPDANKDVIGLEIYDDVVLGRAGAASDPEPDFDLSIYDAILHGVSRRHALLRPTEGQLFLIDLNSTNGTQVNAVAQEGGMARALRHNDTLSMGNLHLIVKIMRRA